MLPACDLGKVKTQIVGKEHGIGAPQEKRRRPVPPAREESPEITKRGAYPTIEAALHRHGSRELSGHERNGDAPEKWQNEMVNQRHARAGSSDLIFETERPRRRVGIHHENEV